MDQRIPAASVDWQKDVPPEVVDEIMRLPQAIVQRFGCPEVIYVNCSEGGVTVPLLHKGDQPWLEVPNHGGPGGGAQHPRGVILIGPAGVDTLLSKVEWCVEVGVHPDCNTNTDKLRQGTLRLLPPTPFLKMCGVYRHKMNAYKALRVTRTRQSVSDFFHYGQQQQQANQAHTPQQHTPQPRQAPAAATPAPASHAEQSPLDSSPPSADLDQDALQPPSPPGMMPPPRTPQAPTNATLRSSSAAAPQPRTQPPAGRAPATSCAGTQPAGASFHTAVPSTKLEESPASVKTGTQAGTSGTHANTSSKRGPQGAAGGKGRPEPSLDLGRDDEGSDVGNRSSKRRKISQMQEQIQEWEEAEQRADHDEKRAHEAQRREHRQQMELAELQQKLQAVEAELKSTSRVKQELQKQARESRAAEDAAYKKLSGHGSSTEP